MWVEPISDHPELVADVAHRMREWDRREIFATRPNDDCDALARDAVAIGAIGWTAGLERPIAAFGCAEMWPGVYSMWLFATDEFHQIRFSMTRLVKRRIVPMLFDAGAHRLEARSMEGHHDAQGWLKLIGARREATLKAYGKDRQDFHLYVWGRG